MHQPNNALSQCGPQTFEPFFSSNQIADFAFFHQGADPIALAPVFDCSAEPVNHLIHPLGTDQGRLDRLTAGRFFIQNRYVHVTVLRQCKRAGNGRGGHHQDIGLFTLLSQFQPLTHAKAVLFIHNCQT